MISCNYHTPIVSNSLSLDPISAIQTHPTLFRILRKSRPRRPHIIPQPIFFSRRIWNRLDSLSRERTKQCIHFRPVIRAAIRIPLDLKIGKETNNPRFLRAPPKMLLLLHECCRGFPGRGTTNYRYFFSDSTAAVHHCIVRHRPLF